MSQHSDAMGGDELGDGYQMQEAKFIPSILPCDEKEPKVNIPLSEQRTSGSQFKVKIFKFKVTNLLCCPDNFIFVHIRDDRRPFCLFPFGHQSKD